MQCFLWFCDFWLVLKTLVMYFLSQGFRKDDGHHYIKSYKSYSDIIRFILNTQPKVIKIQR